MIDNDTFIIAKDGFKCIAASVALMLFLMVIDADVLTFLSFVLVLLTLWAYRNPERVIPYLQEDSIVSVADGVIRSIETLEDDEGTSGYKIVIRTGFLDTSILRAPFACKVKETKSLYGARLSSSMPLSKKLNEQSDIVFGGDEKQVRVSHNLQLSSVGIKNRLIENYPVAQGLRYGLMVKGNTTIVLPKNSRVAVKVGQNVRAGETLIGFFS
ncbi:MAG: phosphatidylserine decarboxylase [Thiovulaceae bacterium]|nr:phosphatidylserine decarboxylase [Sulfurimonadaceae bacterium]